MKLQDSSVECKATTWRTSETNNQFSVSLELRIWYFVWRQIINVFTNFVGNTYVLTIIVMLSGSL